MNRSSVRARVAAARKAAARLVKKARQKARQRKGPWSIILAGGEGERVRPLIQRWLHKHKPKQYCAFVGKRSMLQHTLARADLLSPRERQITVVRNTHFGWLRGQFRGRRRGAVIFQPGNRDTGAGIFLPLTYVRHHDPNATVVIHPSDHFVHPASRFVDIVSRAVAATETLGNKLILLGVAPDEPETEYGWIIPGKDLGPIGGRRVREVQRFVEKPDAAGAEAALAAGGCWNTLVFAVKLRTLWKLGWRCFPEMMMLFEQLGAAIGTPGEKHLLDAVYQVMPACNFSSGLLARAADQVAVIELDEVVWSDWGKPERIAATLHRIGKQPAFPIQCMTG